MREPSDALQTPRRTGPHRTVKVHPRTPKGVVRVAAREQVTEAQARLQLRLWEHPRAVLQQGCLQACDGAEDTLLRVDRDLHTATSPTAARAERERRYCTHHVLGKRPQRLRDLLEIDVTGALPLARVGHHPRAAFLLPGTQLRR